MDVAAAQVFGADHFAGRGLHQRRAAEEDRALFLDDDRLVAHRRHVGAARGAGAHDDGDLRDALGRQIRLVVEDAAEVVAVGEHVVLVRQVGAARVDQVDAGQVVLLGDLLRAQVFFHRHRVIGAALDGGIVTDDHALLARYAADAGDDAGAGGGAVIHLIGGQLREFEEGRARIEQVFDALARQQLAPRKVLGASSVATALGQLRNARTQVVHHRLHRCGIGLEVLAARVQFALDLGHVPSSAFVSFLSASRGATSCQGNCRPGRTSEARHPGRVRARSG